MELKSERGGYNVGKIDVDRGAGSPAYPVSNRPTMDQQRPHFVRTLTGGSGTRVAESSFTFESQRPPMNYLGTIEIHVGPWQTNIGRGNAGETGE